ncbi:MAG: ATP-binding protein [Myxococcaceae bacterium]|nr:ATP-binding protein [Myxococcaceae bacterium]
MFRTIATTTILALASSQLAARRFGDGEGLAWFVLVVLDYLLTLVTGVVVRRRRYGTWMGWLQVVAAVTFATAIIVLTDFSVSPFWFTYLLAIIGAAVVLGLRGALGAAALTTSSSIAVTTWEHVAGTGRPWLDTATQVLAQVLVAGLSGYVAQQLIRTRGRLVASEADLARTRDLRDRIVNAISSGLAVVERGSGRLRFLNPAGASILGLAEGSELPLARELFGDVLSMAAGRRWEVVSNTRRGERILGISVSPLDAPELVLVVFQDLTDVRRREDEMARLDQLAQLGRVSATLAHEVRNPLASMRGSAQMLLSDALAGSSQEKLSRIIVREADRLGYLVEHYLELARPKPPERKLVRIDTIVSETVEVLRADPVARGTLIEEVLSPREAEVDAAQMKQVLINLLRNAFRAAGPKGRVRVTVEPAPHEYLFTVWDSAGSIAPEALPHVFEPFFSQSPDGTGLGLSTAQSIAHAHGATIDARSSAEEGTSFSFRLGRGEGVHG